MKKDDDAASTIVTVIMIISIAMSVAASLMAIYIPMWRTDSEEEHMGQVKESFIQLKGTLDSQLYSSGYATSLSTSMPLAADEEAMFNIRGIPGSLTFRPVTDTTEVTTVTVFDSETPTNIYARGGGDITFESNNVYYTDQTYKYEAGSVLLVQGGGSTMLAQPDWEIEVDSTTLLRDTGEYGNILAGDTSHVNNMSYYIPQENATLRLSFQGYSVSDGEVKVLSNGVEVAVSTSTVVAQWGSTQYVMLHHTQLDGFGENNITFENTLNPPGSDTWGVRNVVIERLNVSLAVNMPTLMGSPNSISGSTSAVVQTTLANSYDIGSYSFSSGRNITINLSTEESGPWEKYFQDVFEEFIGYYVITSFEDMISVEIRAVNDLSLGVSVVSVKIN